MRRPATKRIAEGVVFYTDGLITHLPMTIHNVEVNGSTLKVTMSVGHEVVGQPKAERLTFSTTIAQALALGIVERE